MHPDNDPVVEAAEAAKRAGTPESPQTTRPFMFDAFELHLAALSEELTRREADLLSEEPERFENIYQRAQHANKLADLAGQRGVLNYIIDQLPEYLVGDESAAADETDPQA